MIGYIYKLTSPNGKIYIGQTNDIKRRFKEYSKPSYLNRPYKVSRSIKKYGWESFKKEIIYTGDYNINLLNDLEIHFINLYNSVNKGLNTQLGGMNGFHSESTKIKMSESAKKLWLNKTHSNKHWIGRKHSDESKKKMSDKRKGRKLNKQWRDNITKALIKRGGKLVLNMETGVYYNSVREASDSCNYAHSSLKNMLNGYKRNKTSFIKV